MNNINSLISEVTKAEGVLFILCGFPYAGKSYLSSQIQQQTDIHLVVVDDIFKAKGFAWDTSVLPSASEWELIFEESYNQTKSALTAGKNVLYDSTNHTIESRDRLREVGHSVGADVRVLFIKSTPESVWERWQENLKQHNRPVISKELVQATIDAFEPPTEQEMVIVVYN